jgi:hypothetical protein
MGLGEVSGEMGAMRSHGNHGGGGSDRIEKSFLLRSDDSTRPFSPFSMARGGEDCTAV